MPAGGETLNSRVPDGHWGPLSEVWGQVSHLL